MRYYSFNEHDEDGGRIVTLSEDEIKARYWDYWYGKMTDKYGKEHVDANYCWEDCLDNWIVVHWAWE